MTRFRHWIIQLLAGKDQIMLNVDIVDGGLVIDSTRPGLFQRCCITNPTSGKGITVK